MGMLVGATEGSRIECMESIDDEGEETHRELVDKAGLYDKVETMLRLTDVAEPRVLIRETIDT